MKKIIKSNIKTLFLVSYLFFFINCIGCSSSDESTPEPLVVDTVTPISELAKEWDFTAVAAHRCYFRSSPENSLAAIQDGIDLGVEFLEADTRTTSDGVIILFHDATVNRVTNGSGTVSEMTYNSIGNLKLKNKDGVLTDEPIATLEQALLKIKGKNVYMHIEVKDFNFSKVASIIKNTEMENQVVVFANDRASYNTLSSFEGIFVDPVCRNSDDFNFYFSKSNTPLLNLAGSQFNAANTLAAKNGNKLTWRGITNKPEDEELISGAVATPNLDALIQVNPAIIHTDYADLLIAFLKNKDKRE